MVSICLYFHVHQPYRLKKYSVFEIAKHANYFDTRKNIAILEKITKKCYIPMNNLLLKQIHQNNIKAAFSFSGVMLEQLEEHAPEVIQSFQDLVSTGNVEVIDETYHHSLAFLFSKKEFKSQVKMHNRKVKQLFGTKPSVFRNTELIYNNELAHCVEEMGYKGILTEGADHILGWRSPNFLYRPKGTKTIKLLLKNYRLSDDIAFRFSERTWKEWPLSVPKYVNWLNAVNGNGHTINLFMDYETFGEHQWASTGIFKFMDALPSHILKHPDNNFKTPSELISEYEPVAELDIPHVISWADVERDVSAWLGNPMQQESIRSLYQMEEKVLATKDKELIRNWRRLQTSDHFYYMCTKWFNDGDVHKYFNPYDSPYDAFITFMNILTDITQRTDKLQQSKIAEVPITT
ncbi:MAG: glycoside hydrolase family 57 protein [Candidatus Woesearchaeota archaeon]